ncbi:MAG: RNA polymerase sigma factor [Bacteroidales bacterium]|nr:RNA polymerase sigma factor [Bacteroidales bacterium]MCB8998864.1 RNA polymerase sigma factor [Bacteroidales bacterium]MCB9013997.1 RNA polymerase sigma factor [Bacteroidales bacterium]
MNKAGQFLNVHEKLVENCRNGSLKAQEELYKLYYKAMYNASFRIVNNREDAEDIMQESFLKAFRNIQLYKGEVSFGAWLKKIVINQSLDYLRKKKLEFISLETENLKEISEKDDENELDDKVRLDAVIRELANLPDGYRLILSLYLLEGYDHDEISQILGISSSTSRSQYIRGKKRLLENLKKKEK